MLRFYQRGIGAVSVLNPAHISPADVLFVSLQLTSTMWLSCCVSDRALCRESSSLQVRTHVLHSLTDGGFRWCCVQSCNGIFALFQCSSSPTQLCLEPTLLLFSSEPVRSFCYPAPEGKERVTAFGSVCWRWSRKSWKKWFGQAAFWKYTSKVQTSMQHTLVLPRVVPVNSGAYES